MNSTRLPGKVLFPLGDTTLLGQTVRRVHGAKKVDTVLVATSTKPTDDAIAEYCAKEGIAVFRGSLSDVLDRYYQAAKNVGANAVVRITADCPLIDPALIDQVVGEFQKSDVDYVSTGRIVSTYPDGMDTEVVSFKALERAWQEAKLQSEREHVTPYIWNHPEMFIVKEVKYYRDLSAVRLTVDEPEDYEMIKQLLAGAGDLSMEGIVQYLMDNPEVSQKNASIIRDAGYHKSLQEDEKK